MDPSEANYFALGTDLLSHRSIWEASESFSAGAQAYPKSVRLQTAWGTALFAGGRYDQAARQLCIASDLAPADLEAYTFIGSIALVAAVPDKCTEQKLERFLDVAPKNASAPYFLAMLLVKQGDHPETERARRLLERAVSLNPKYAEAHLQLGILAYKARDYEQAVQEFLKAIQSDDQLAEAHYRLAVAYDRVGRKDLARVQFQLHDQLQKTQAVAVDQQRQEIKQFVMASQASPESHSQP